MHRLDLLALFQRIAGRAGDNARPSHVKIPVISKSGSEQSARWATVLKVIFLAFSLSFIPLLLQPRAMSRNNIPADPSCIGPMPLEDR